jgi:hypothetical protein
MWLEIGVTAFFLCLMNCDIDYAAENKWLDWVECHCCSFEQTVPDDDDLSSTSCDSQEKTSNDNNRTGNLDDVPLLDEEKEGDNTANLPSDASSAIVCENNIQAAPTMITLSSQAIVKPTRSDNPLPVQENGVEAPVEEQSSTAKSINHQPAETQDPTAVDSKTSSRSSIKDDQRKESSKSTDAELHRNNEQETIQTDSDEMEIALSQEVASKTGSNKADERVIMQGAQKVIAETETCNTTVSSSKNWEDASVSRASSQSIAKSSVSNDSNQSIAKEETSCTNVVGQIQAASIDDAEQVRLNSPPTWATLPKKKSNPLVLSKYRSRKNCTQRRLSVIRFIERTKNFKKSIMKSPSQLQTKSKPKLNYKF